MESIETRRTLAPLKYNEVATVLLKDSGSLEHSPRSVSVEMPTSLGEMSDMLKGLASMPVEFLLMYEAEESVLKIVTGSKISPVHGDIEGQYMVDEDIRISKAPFMHNHPDWTGWVKTSPSIGDWSALAHVIKSGGYRKSWIITSEGITEFSFPGEIVVDDFLCGSIRAKVKELDHQLVALHPDLEKKIEALGETTLEEKRYIMKTEERLVWSFKGVVEVFAWDDPRVNVSLNEFLSSCTPKPNS